MDNHDDDEILHSAGSGETITLTEAIQVSDADAIRTAITDAIHDTINRLREIVDTGNAREAIAAGRVLAGIAADEKRFGQQARGAIPVETLSAAEVSQLTRQQKYKLIQGNPDLMRRL